jgi:transmembrane sensor
MARLLAGELGSDSNLPAGEAAAVRARIDADPALATLFHALETTDLKAGSAEPDVAAALARVRLRMQAPPRRNPTRIWLPIAAAVVLAAGIFMYTQPDDGGPVAAAAPQVFRTATGERDSIRLADGSSVVLGPGSELTVEAGFPQTRHVTLKGQARFDVVHDAARLFTVRTAQGVITDLGTTFTITEFDGAAIDVTVQSGSVRLSAAQSPDSGIVLTAGEAGTLNTGGVLTRDTRAASDEDLAWMSGRLVFRDTPMVKVRAELRRWYGVELVTSDSGLAQQKLTGSYRDESLTEILDIISLALGARYETHGDTIILQKARRTPVR